MPELVGFLVVLLAASAYVHCAWLFAARGRGTPLPFAPPREFVVRGLYGYTRNPMALAVVAGVAGAALLLGSPLGFGLAGLLALALHLYITRREEPELGRRFGEAYGSYCGGRAGRERYAAFRASDDDALLEPPGGVSSLALDGRPVSRPTKLRNGDIVSVPGGRVLRHLRRHEPVIEPRLAVERP